MLHLCVILDLVPNIFVIFFIPANPHHKSFPVDIYRTVRNLFILFVLLLTLCVANQPASYSSIYLFLETGSHGSQADFKLTM